MNERQDRPQVDELEVGDVIHTAGLDGLDDTEVRVLENSPLSLDDRYLVTEPSDQPGAVTRGPQRADTVVTRVRRAGEMTYPEFLRQVADLLEQVPELPHDEFGLSYSVGNPADPTLDEKLRGAHKALDRLGIAHEFRDTNNGISIGIEVARSRRLHMSHMRADAWAASEARRSYEDVVQVGSAEGGA